jgi:transposase
MQTQSNKLNFKGQNIYAGIDVHKKSWTVCIYSERFQSEHVIFSQPPTAGALKTCLDRDFPGANYYSVYEAGFCGFHVHEKLSEAGIKNIVVNASDVPTKHKEKINKSDKHDSRKLGRALRAGELEGIHIPTRKTQEDRSLLRMRCTIRKDLTRIKVRIKMLLHFYGIEHPEEFSSSAKHWSHRYIEWLRTIPMEENSGRATLQALIREAVEMRKVQLTVTRQIRELSMTESYRKDYELLRGIKGIGLMTCMSFLTEIEDINRFSSADRLASYVGLIPSCRSSGEKEKTGTITSKKQELLREMIIESAWKAAQNDPALRLAFKEYCKRMKPNKAIIRIGRKLLNRIYYVLKTKNEYICGIVK